MINPAAVTTSWTQEPARRRQRRRLACAWAVRGDCPPIPQRAITALPQTKPPGATPILAGQPRLRQPTRPALIDGGLSVTFFACELPFRQSRRPAGDARIWLLSPRPPPSTSGSEPCANVLAFFWPPWPPLSCASAAWPRPRKKSTSTASISAFRPSASSTRPANLPASTLNPWTGSPKRWASRSNTSLWIGTASSPPFWPKRSTSSLPA